MRTLFEQTALSWADCFLAIGLIGVVLLAITAFLLYKLLQESQYQSFLMGDDEEPEDDDDSEKWKRGR